MVKTGCNYLDYQALFQVRIFVNGNEYVDKIALKVRTCGQNFSEESIDNLIPDCEHRTSLGYSYSIYPDCNTGIYLSNALNGAIGNRTVMQFVRELDQERPNSLRASATSFTL